MQLPTPFFLTLMGCLLVAPALAQDFDSNGYGDLVVSVPNEDVGGLPAAGVIHVSYVTGNEVRYQPTTGHSLGPESWALFGRATTWGDYNGDGHHDLAVSAPGATVQGKSAAGVVIVFYGTANGLDFFSPVALSQNTSGVAGVAEAGDQFGWSLTTGNFDNDNFDDIAVGAPFETIGGVDAAGVVHVLFGSNAGITGSGDVLFSQYYSSVSGVAEAWDLFGWTLAAGDFDDDGFDDLVVGTPHEDVGSVVDAGVVQVFPFSWSGYQSSFQQLWSQSSNGIEDSPGTSDHFGWSLAVGDFDFYTIGGDDDVDDLAIGVPNETIGGASGAGAVHLLFGNKQRNGLVEDGEWFFHQNMNSAWQALAESGDAFGYSLAALDRWDGTAALVIGVPREDWYGLTNAGVIHYLGRNMTGWGLGSHVSATLSADDMWSTSNYAQAGANFGYSLAGFGVPSVDSNGWAVDQNLGIAAPWQDIDGRVNSGLVMEANLTNGSATWNAYWNFTQRFFPHEPPEDNDRLGSSLPR